MGGQGSGIGSTFLESLDPDPHFDLDPKFCFEFFPIRIRKRIFETLYLHPYPYEKDADPKPWRREAFSQFSDTSVPDTFFIIQIQIFQWKLRNFRFGSLNPKI